MGAHVSITQLPNHGDGRGFSFSLPREALDFLGGIAEMHLASMVAGAVRGNHYHRRKKEALILLPGSAWSFHWDDGEGTSVQHRSFNGTNAVIALISPGCSHAVRNDGTSLLWLVACSSQPYEPSEVVRRKIV